MSEASMLQDNNGRASLRPAQTPAAAGIRGKSMTTLVNVSHMQDMKGRSADERASGWPAQADDQDRGRAGRRVAEDGVARDQQRALGAAGNPWARAAAHRPAPPRGRAVGRQAA